MQNTLVIGQVVKPQGIKGELKVVPITDDPVRFKQLKSVIIDGKTYRVAGAKIAANGVFLSLLGITDRNTAELFRGKFLHVLREDLAPIKEGRYYIVDVIGCTLFDGEKEIGKITDVTQGRTDVITAVTSDGKTLRFPFLKDAVESVDTINKIFTVKAKRFGEIVVYED